jgi:glycine/sarcosine N-methyltransferase
VLDVSCGIGTQALGLARKGYRVHGTDLSTASVGRARREAAELGVAATFAMADMRRLGEEVEGRFDVVLSADNAIAHLLTEAELAAAFRGMRARVRAGGLVVVTLREYDTMLRERPRTSGPGVFDDPGGQRIVFHVFDWEGVGDLYRNNIFVVRQTDGGWTTLHWSTRSRAWRRGQVEAALTQAGLGDVRWWTPEESGFLQLLVTADAGVPR